MDFNYWRTTCRLHKVKPEWVNRKCSTQTEKLLHRLSHQQIQLCSLSLFCCLSQSNTPPPGLSSCARTPRRRCWRQEWLLGSWGWYHDRGPAHLHGIWCIWTVPPWSTWVSPQWRLKEEEWWRLHGFIEVVVCIKMSKSTAHLVPACVSEWERADRMPAGHTYWRWCHSPAGPELLDQLNQHRISGARRSSESETRQQTRKRKRHGEKKKTESLLIISKLRSP